MSLEEVYRPDALPEAVEEYTLRSCLKHTGDAWVYLVEKNGERFILKRAAGPVAPALREEFALLSALDLSFLPRSVDCFEVDGAVWLLRTYREGRTLAQLVDGRGPMAESGAAKAALSVCAMLECLHSQTPPIIHRDVKPENVVVSPGGEYSLIDMGTARRWREEACSDTVALGTRATAAPEQFGYAQTDVRADVYGVGMLLTYLATGAYGKEKGDLKFLSPRLRRVIRKCTVFDPKGRYANVKRVVCALRAAVQRPSKRRRSRVP